MEGPELIVILATIGSVTALGFAFFRALGRYWERKGQTGGSSPEVRALAGRLEGVELELAALRDADTRLQDLEERLDFAERVLARHKSPPLPGDV